MKAITHTKILTTPLRFAMSLDALRRGTPTDYVKARKKEHNIINRTITKVTPPAFVDRANPDIPPAITEHVRELARVMKNRNALVRMPADPLDYEKRREAWYLSTLASLNISSDKYRSICVSKVNNAPDTRRMTYFRNWHTEGAFANTDTSEKFHMVIDGKKYKGGLTWYYLREHAPTIDNVNTNDKPAFRHDSLFLFDKLSEDYSA